MNIIEVLEQEQLRSDIPEFKAGKKSAKKLVWYEYFSYTLIPQHYYKLNFLSS